VAIVVPATIFREMLTEHETVRAWVCRMLSTRLSEATALVGEVAFGTVAERLAHRVAILLLRARGPRPAVQVTHPQLAADLGTAREVVSRSLKDLERMGAIALGRGRIELRNAEPLRARAIPRLRL
jgi:CRP/FNR family transcriptional regulator